MAGNLDRFGHAVNFGEQALGEHLLNGIDSASNHREDDTDLNGKSVDSGAHE